MTIRVEKSGPVTTVIIARPEARNAIDRDTAAALVDAFTAFEKDESALAAVLFGDAGTFCAGADLKAIAAGRPNRLDEARGPLGPTRMLLTKPVIAAVAGHAVAGGLELALWCDLRVAEEDAVLGVFCRRFGVPLLDGGTVRLPRLIGLSRALDMILTGRAVGAAEALSFGLVNRVVARGQARAAAEQLAREIASFPQECLRGDRLSAHEQHALALDAALVNEHRRGLPAVAASVEAGAKRFAGGEGRHGAFGLGALLLATALASCTFATSRALAQDGSQKKGSASEDQDATEREIGELNAKGSEKHRAKDYDGAIAIYRNVIVKVAASSLDDSSKRSYEKNARYNIACALSLAGKKSEAIGEFARAIELGFRSWRHIEEDGDLDPIRADEQFKKAVEHGKSLEAAEIAADVKEAVDEVKKNLAAKPLIAGYDFDVRTTDGKRITLADWKGRVGVVAYFWPSIADEKGILFPELRHLVTLRQATRRQDNVEVLGIAMAVNYDADGSVLADFMKKRGINFPVAKVEADKMQDGMPLVFIDRQGNVRAKLKKVRRYEVVEAIVKTLLEAE